MEVFLEQLKILRSQFDALSSDDHENALAAVADAVAAMRDASVRRRFEKEIELTLAWEAEKVIVERFAGNWSAGLYNEHSTSSFDFESLPMFFENSVVGKDFDSIWAKSIDRDVSGSAASLEHQLTSSPASLNQEMRFIDGSEMAASNLQETVIDDVVGNGEAVGAGSNESSSPTSREHDVSKENRLVCATCGFMANNRKALYRHGLRTQHVLREPNSSGYLACSQCSFRTNKMFNYNRHLKRFHAQQDR